MRPLRKKIAIAIAASLGLLLVVLITLPFLFQDRIAARLKTEIGRSVNARVAWTGVSLSLLRDFPNASVSLDGLSVTGVSPFAGDTLASVRQARLVLDLGSVVRYLTHGDRIVIRQIVLRQPAAKLLVLADGRANWDIVRDRGASRTEAPSAVGISLRELRVSDGRLTLDDRHARVTAAVSGLDESLRGDFASKRFVLSTRTRADSVSLRFAGIPWLSRVGLALNADVDADVAAHRFTFANDSLRLNRLVLAFGGSVTTGAPNLGVTLSFSTPSTAFGEILSLVPAVYASDFRHLRTAGRMSVSGSVRGAYGPHAFPAFAVRARVENGAFQYATLPLPARDIALDLALDNPGGSVDSTVVAVRRLHAAIGGRPLDARLVVRTPVSDPDVDVALTGALDLADIGRTVALSGVKELKGLVAADAAMHARLSDVDARRYDRVAARGTVQLSRVVLRTDAVPRPIAVDTAALRLTPRTAELTAFRAVIGGSDLRATGALDNVLGFVLRGDDLRGSATVGSTRFALDEWRSKDRTTDVIPVPPHVDFALKAAVDTVTYGALRLANVRGDIRVKDQRVTLDSLRMDALRGSLVATGFYETTVADRPTFDFGVRLASVDIPSAFAALATVQKLAPIARWAQGSMSGTVALSGPLGKDMVPVFSALSGKGAIETGRLLMQGAPVLDKVASAFSLEQVRKPTIGAMKVAFDVANGRLRVKPFVVQADGIALTIAGSNGIDQSIAYDLALAVPRTALGAAAASTVASLASRAGAGSALSTGAAVQLRAQVTGTVTDPAVKADFGGMAASVTDAAQAAIRQAGTARVDSVKQKVDSAATAAVARARADADRILADAQRQADTIRAAARAVATSMRAQASARADSLVARASNPVARVAAQAAADRLRRAADEQAERAVHEADARADAIVALAKRRADSVVASPKR